MSQKRVHKFVYLHAECRFSSQCVSLFAIIVEKPSVGALGRGRIVTVRIICSGAVVVRTIRADLRASGWDMGNIAQAEVKKEVMDQTSSPPSQVEQSRVEEKAKESEISQLERTRRRFCGCSCYICLKILYTAVGVITVLKAIAVIITAVAAAVASKIYNAGASGRLVALVILVITAGVCISITIYAVIGLYKSHGKPLHLAAVLLVVLAIIQAIIAGASLKVSSQDEYELGRALADSLNLAKANNPKHHQIWATTQHDLNCCGTDGPEDYRTANLPRYFPPNVPISCCPSYLAARSELVQERQRETCRNRREYYDLGCKDQVIDVIKETTKLVLSVTVVLIIFEIVLAIFSAILYRKHILYIRRKRTEDNAGP